MSNERDDDGTKHETSGDPIFLAAVHSLNKGEYEGPTVGVTATVGGVSLTGELISMTEYIELMGFNPESARVFLESYDSAGVPRFFHMKNARLISGTILVPTNMGMLWRGRISDVSGFSMGALGGVD